MTRHSLARKVRRMEETLLTVGQAADVLGVHHQTIRGYIRDGHLKARRIGSRTIRISASDLDAFMQPIEVNDR